MHQFEHHDNQLIAYRLDSGEIVAQADDLESLCGVLEELTISKHEVVLIDLRPEKNPPGQTAV